MSRITAITIDRTTGDGKYDDVLDVAAEVAGDCGSATNAVAVMVRQSQLFKQAQAKLSKSKRADDQPDAS